MVWRRKNILLYFADYEVRTYFLVLLFVAIAVVSILLNTQVDQGSSLRQGVFQTISFATTTGFVTQDVSQWPAAAGTILLLAAFAGGCAGSTAGGIKLVRVLMIYLQGMREVRRLIHPNGVFPIKLGKTPVSDRLIESVWSFFSVYVLLFFLSVTVIMLASDLDFLTAFSAVGATLNNLGPGLGEVAYNYVGLDASVKWVLMFNMMLGRLEIFTLLVLLTPAYWRR